MTSKPDNPSKPGKARKAGGAIILAIANFKGGVGKSTTALCLGGELAARGSRVLLVDCDMQANATKALFPQGFTTATVGHLLLTPKLPQCLRAYADANRPAGEEPLHLHLLPSGGVLLAEQEQQLQQRPAYHQLLTQALAPFADAYDYILLDCPTGIGVLTQMALCAARYYLVPCLPEKFSFDGLKELAKVAGNIAATHNPALQMAGIVFTQHNDKQLRSRRLSREMVLAAGHVYGAEFILPSIRVDAALAEAQTCGELVLRYAPASNGVADNAAFTTALLNRF